MVLFWCCNFFRRFLLFCVVVIRGCPWGGAAATRKAAEGRGLFFMPAPLRLMTEGGGGGGVEIARPPHARAS